MTSAASLLNRRMHMNPVVIVTSGGSETKPLGTKKGTKK